MTQFRKTFGMINKKASYIELAISIIAVAALWVASAHRLFWLIVVCACAGIIMHSLALFFLLKRFRKEEDERKYMILVLRVLVLLVFILGLIKAIWTQSVLINLMIK